MTLSFAINPPQALACYSKNGYFVEPHVLPEEFCDQLIATANRLSRAATGDFTPVMQAHRQDPIFLHAMKYPTLVSIIECLLEGVAYGLQTEFFYSKPNVRGFASHQDNFFVEAAEDSFVSAWIALTDAGPENGGLIGFPGSHREGRLPVRSINTGRIEGQDPNASNEETILPVRYSPVDIVAPKSAAVFLHAHFVHGSHVNRSNAFRYALLCTYIREGAYFRPGTYAQRSPIKLHDS